MFIQTEETPNPATLKFLPGQSVMEDTTAYFADPEAASRSPLAARLFEVPGVTEVFFGADFITVAKSPDREWELLKPAILDVVTEHFAAGRPIMHDPAAQQASSSDDEEEDEVVSQIKELLDQRVFHQFPEHADKWLVLGKEIAGRLLRQTFDLPNQ